MKPLLYTRFVIPVMLSIGFVAFFSAFLVRQSYNSINKLIFVGTRAGARRYWKNISLYKEGYDGQYYFYIAHDPFDTQYLRRVLDVPAHRYQRILYPFLVWLITGGNHKSIPVVMFLCNMFMIPLSTLLINLVLQQKRVADTKYYYAGVFIPSFLFSLKYNLAEPLACVLLLGGILLYIKKKWFFSGVLFLLSTLARESALIFLIVGCIHTVFTKKDVRLRLPVFVVPVILYFLWCLNVSFLFGADKMSAFDLLSTHYGNPLVNIVAYGKNMLLSPSSLTNIYPSVLVFFPFILLVLSATGINLHEMIIKKRYDTINISTILCGMLIVFYGSNIWMGPTPVGYLRVSEMFFVFALINFATMKKYKPMLLFYPAIYMCCLNYMFWINDIGNFNFR